MAEQIKLVCDSSADIYSLEGVPFSSAPLKIINDENEYVDNENLDIKKMVEELAKYKGKVSTACPSPGDWLDAFGDATQIFAIAIGSNVSGSYNSLLTAKEIYESENPGRKVVCVDSGDAGSGMNMIAMKAYELIKAGVELEKIGEEIETYKDNIGNVFMLASVHNFANNGRVNPLIAKAIGILNIKVVAHKSLDHKIEICEKVRGDNRGLQTMMKRFEKEGITGTKITIGHVFNLPLAERMRDMMHEAYPNAEINIYQLHGLCSFYAENQGLLVGFERDVEKVKKSLLEKLKN